MPGPNRVPTGEVYSGDRTRRLSGNSVNNNGNGLIPQSDGAEIQDQTLDTNNNIYVLLLLL